MISAFRIDGVAHGARLHTETTITRRNGIEGELTKSWWIPLCSITLVGSTHTPSAPITCLECREVLFGEN